MQDLLSPCCSSRSDGRLLRAIQRHESISGIAERRRHHFEALRGWAFLLDQEVVFIDFLPQLRVLNSISNQSLVEMKQVFLPYQVLLVLHSDLAEYFYFCVPRHLFISILRTGRCFSRC